MALSLEQIKLLFPDGIRVHQNDNLEDTGQIIYNWNSVGNQQFADNIPHLFHFGLMMYNEVGSEYFMVDWNDDWYKAPAQWNNYKSFDNNYTSTVEDYIIKYGDVFNVIEEDKIILTAPETSENTSAENTNIQGTNMTNEQNAQELLDQLLEAFRLVGAHTGVEIESKVQAVLESHDLDVDAINATLALIDTELKKDDQSEVTILNSIATNLSEINALKLRAGVIETAATTLEAKVDLNKANQDTKNGLLDSEDVRLNGDIQAEIRVRREEITRVEGIVSGNKTAIESTVSDLSGVVSGNKAAQDLVNSAQTVKNGELDQKNIDQDLVITNNKTATDAAILAEVNERKSEVSRVEGIVSGNKTAIESTVSSLTDTVAANKLASDTKNTALDAKNLEQDGKIASNLSAIEGNQAEIINIKSSLSSSTGTLQDNLDAEVLRATGEEGRIETKFDAVQVRMDAYSAKLGEFTAASALAAFQNGMTPPEV
jgi:hypothetical protein